jgi:hypothetical protein
LQRELKNHTYKIGRSICFVVTKPKAREIFAADFRDRIVHHVLVDYLESIWEPKFVYQSYSCRKGKGTHQAIKDLKKYLRKINHNDHKPAFYLQIDIQSFFVSLRKDVLFELIKKRVKNPEILWLTKTIIFHDSTIDFYRKSQMSLFDLIPDHKSLFKVPSNQGLPIGNLTSQFFANVYLDELDQFIKHKLKIKYYLRYVDDVVILSENKEQLKIWRNEIDSFLEKMLKLKLHPKKQILQSVDKGINFVGFVVKPEYTLMRRRVVKNLKEKLRIFNQNLGKVILLKDGSLKEFRKKEGKQMLSVINSYYGQFKHAHTFGLRSKLWQKNFGELKRFLKSVDKNLSYFKIK